VVFFSFSSLFSVLYSYLFNFKFELIFYLADLACFIHTRISSGYYKFLSGVLSNLIWHHNIGLIIIIGI
jgi:hypothetical protein